MSPKQLYLRDKDKAARLRDRVAHPEFEEALMAAFNQMCWSLPDGGDAPLRNDTMRLGARRFIAELMSLGAEVTTPPRETPPSGTLLPQDDAYRKRHART